ncbi:hypothetical protein VNI00_016809 [Paramarasmius palmivorus]|uniref:Uncharacterized protein n=1 Tax=Paramarasmius palmivorus TaxID=297713 RepID=A0AAW0BBR9_9AGAR
MSGKKRKGSTKKKELDIALKKHEGTLEKLEKATSAAQRLQDDLNTQSAKTNKTSSDNDRIQKARVRLRKKQELIGCLVADLLVQEREVQRLRQLESSVLEDTSRGQNVDGEGSGEDDSSNLPPSKRARIQTTLNNLDSSQSFPQARVIAEAGALRKPHTPHQSSTDAASVPASLGSSAQQDHDQQQEITNSLENHHNASLDRGQLLSALPADDGGHSKKPDTIAGAPLTTATSKLFGAPASNFPTTFSFGTAPPWPGMQMEPQTNGSGGRMPAGESYQEGFRFDKPNLVAFGSNQAVQSQQVIQGHPRISTEPMSGFSMSLDGSLGLATAPGIENKTFYQHFADPVCHRPQIVPPGLDVPMMDQYPIPINHQDIMGQPLLGDMFGHSHNPAGGSSTLNTEQLQEWDTDDSLDEGMVEKDAAPPLYPYPLPEYAPLNNPQDPWTAGVEKLGFSSTTNGTALRTFMDFLLRPPESRAGADGMILGPDLQETWNFWSWAVETQCKGQGGPTTTIPRKRTVPPADKEYMKKSTETDAQYHMRMEEAIIELIRLFLKTGGKHFIPFKARDWVRQNASNGRLAGLVCAELAAVILTTNTGMIKCCYHHYSDKLFKTNDHRKHELYVKAYEARIKAEEAKKAAEAAKKAAEEAEQELRRLGLWQEVAVEPIEAAPAPVVTEKGNGARRGNQKGRAGTSRKTETGPPATAEANGTAKRNTKASGRPKQKGKKGKGKGKGKGRSKPKGPRLPRFPSFLSTGVPERPIQTVRFRNNEAKRAQDKGKKKEVAAKPKKVKRRRTEDDDDDDDDEDEDEDDEEESEEEESEEEESENDENKNDENENEENEPEAQAEVEVDAEAENDTKEGDNVEEFEIASKPKTGFGHCGCTFEQILASLLVWKVQCHYSPTLDIYETWSGTRPQPRWRNFIMDAAARFGGIRIPVDVYSHLRVITPTGWKYVEVHPETVLLYRIEAMKSVLSKLENERRLVEEAVRKARDDSDNQPIVYC